jgi:hypothetical protein
MSNKTSLLLLLILPPLILCCYSRYGGWMAWPDLGAMPPHPWRLYWKCTRILKKCHGLATLQDVALFCHHVCDIMNEKTASK